MIPSLADSYMQTLVAIFYSHYALAGGIALIGGGLAHGSGKVIDTVRCQRRRGSYVAQSEKVLEIPLPMNLWPVVLACSGLPATAFLARCNRGFLSQLWDAPEFWWHLSACVNLLPMDMITNRGALSFAVTQSWSKPQHAEVLRRRLFRRVLLDKLLRMTPLGNGKSPQGMPPTNPRKRRLSLGPAAGSPIPLEVGVKAKPPGLRGQAPGLALLRDARRAVSVLDEEDGSSTIAAAVGALVGLLRSSGQGAQEQAEVETILHLVASKSSVFSTGQMLDVLGAKQAADAAASPFADELEESCDLA